MTNSASLGEMHRTLASFVRPAFCTRNLVLKIERGSFADVCNIKRKKKGRRKWSNNNLLTARSCFMFIVLLSTEDSSAVKVEKGYQNLLPDQKIRLNMRGKWKISVYKNKRGCANAKRLQHPMIGLQHYEIAQWTQHRPIGGAGHLEENWSKS